MAGKKMTKIKEMARKGQKIGRKPPKIGFQGVLGQKRVKKAIFRPFLAENRPFLVEKRPFLVENRPFLVENRPFLVEKRSFWV
jgi:hypothetical protein